MIIKNTEQGNINISRSVFTNLTGLAATSCFGVKGMAYRSMQDGIVHLLRKESMDKGVLVTYNEDSSVSVELHIVVDRGVNITAVSRSIMNQVSYTLTKETGVTVKSVDIFVDSMTV